MPLHVDGEVHGAVIHIASRVDVELPSRVPFERHRDQRMAPVRQLTLQSVAAEDIPLPIRVLSPCNCGALVRDAQAETTDNPVMLCLVGISIKLKLRQ